MPTTTRRAALVFLLSLAAVAAGPASAQIDPEVRQTLNSLAAFYKGLNSISCSYTIEVNRTDGDKKDGVKLDYSVIAERPNKISFVQGKSDGGVDVISDGTKMTVSIPQLKKYVVEDAPATIGGALEWGALTPLTQFSSIIGELLGPDPAAAILDGVTDATFVGEDNYGGQSCKHIRLVQQEMDVDLWIVSGDKPFLLRMVPDISKETGDSQMKATLDITLLDWKENQTISPNQFEYKPGADITKAESFESIFGGNEDYPAFSLIGKAAPTFQLKGLDGQFIDLGAYLGKNIIVLDFWATWCGPCVRSLPIMCEVTEGFKDKGVLFIAINQGEMPDAINVFLKQMELHPKVALDTDQAVGTKYRVKGIPQSVLIGKSGVVEAVHIGASPILRPQLQNQLTSLVAGRSLIAKPSKPASVSK